MNKKEMNATNKKAGKGNGNSVINNYEHQKNSTSDYVSSGSTGSSSGHNYSQKKHQ